MKLIAILLIILIGLIPSVAKSTNHIAESEELYEFIISFYNNKLDEKIISNLGYGYSLILVQNELSKEEFNALSYELAKCKNRMYDTLSKDLRYRAFFDSLGVAEYFRDLANMIYYSHIKQIEFDLFGLIDSLRNIDWYLDSIAASRVVLDSIDGRYIPTDIYDCINDLKQVLSADDLEKVKNYENAEEASNWEHFGISSRFRFWYKLWGLGSRFAAYFEALGVKIGDHRSSIIMQSLWYDLNGKPIPFKEIIYQHRWYQKTMEKPYNKLAE